jgi:Ca2+-binding EF-hand superfamily protein
MIGSVSNYTSYTSTNSTTTSNARSQQFQKELLTKLDTNSDGSVDQDELKSALSQKSDDGLLVSLSKDFADLDSDDSGSLSSEEMAAMAPPPPPPRGQAPGTELADALISALDADGDGAVSSDELDNGLTSAGSSANSSEIFSALDKDEDGTISKDELAASLAPPPPPSQQVSSEPLFDSLDTGSASAQSVTSEALKKMIANLSKQYSLDNVASVGKYLNVST